jgi:transcriptional regulator with XRE-family HTH domain
MSDIQYNRIKAVLAENKIGNKQLAEKIGVTEQTVSAWCTNKKQPSIEKLYAISKVLKVNIRELLVATNW